MVAGSSPVRLAIYQAVAQLVEAGKKHDLVRTQTEDRFQQTLG